MKKLPAPSSRLINSLYRNSYPLNIFMMLVTSCLLLAACEKEKTYTGFADSYYELLFNSSNYDSYLDSSRPQSSKYFYPCLDKHRARHDREARIRIDACYDRCGADSVCNFNCNIESGTEIFEARRDLLDLKKYTLQQNADIEVLKLQGYYMGEIECLSYNTLRSLQGEPVLSCSDIAIEYESELRTPNNCKLEKYFFESDWDVK